MSVQIANIPSALLQLRQWCVWRLEKPAKEGAKWKKMPRTISGGHGDSTNPARWVTGKEAYDAFVASEKGNNPFNGIGFVFYRNGPRYTGLDFDGWTWDKVQPLVADLLPAYVEVSQSGNGVHVIVRGTLPPAAGGGKKDSAKGIEVYDDERYFAITGHVPADVDGGILPEPDLETDRTEALAAFFEQHLGHLAKATHAPVVPRGGEGLTPEDGALLAALRTNPKVAKRLNRLYAIGEVDERRVSEADFDLACILCQATADNAQVHRIMEASATKRDKFNDHRTYLDITINNARDLHPGPGVTGNGKPRWDLLTSDQFVNLPKPRWLVHSILVEGCLTLLYGMKGSYKSFIAFAIACALRTPAKPTEPVRWLDKYAATPGLVVYVVAEGQGYFGDRIEAADSPDKAHLGPARPALFVFDTLARSMVGGEENSNTDMGIVVDAAGMLQREFNAAVLLVHHTGKEGLTSRGGYALECAADIILRLEKTGPRTVTLGFQNEKFIEEPADQGLQLVPRDQSLIVEAAGTVAPPAKSRKRDANKVAERRDKLVALCVAKPRSKADLCEAVGIGSRTLDGDLKAAPGCGLRIRFEHS